MNLPLCAVILLSVVGVLATAAAGPRVHLAGDSTMADKRRDPPNPEYGWGEALPRFFRDPGCVMNYALNGRSTKSFIDEGHWEKLRGALRPGDWVIVQFGHNDQKSADPTRHAPARTDFAANLRRFITEVRAAGARPALATPVVRRKWNAAGTALVDTHGEYPAVTREVAAAEGVPLLELHELTRQLEEAHGVEGSKRLHLWIPAGEYALKPEGWKDDTHFSKYGADRVAALAVQELLRLQVPLVEEVAR
jgi:lysophospholipase L1-like esterase